MVERHFFPNFPEIGKAILPNSKHINALLVDFTSNGK